MTDFELRMVILSTDDLDESVRFYADFMRFPIAFRDGADFAAFETGSVRLALAATRDHPVPGQAVVAIKTADVDASVAAVESNGGVVVREPYEDAHERRAIVRDDQGNPLVFYSPRNQSPDG